MRNTEVAIVGAGILGLAHAYVAARSGRRVAVFERNPRARGASVRNFGLVWPIGQPAGPLLRMALRSRELWVELLKESGLPYLPTGSLHVAYRQDESDVAEEFCRMAPVRGYECQWLTPAETLARSQAVRPEGLLGALWSPTELTVDPRLVLSALPRFLAERYGVQFHFNTAVTDVVAGTLRAGGESWTAKHIIVTPGDDFQTLVPQCFADEGLTRCKLQMMRTVRQPEGWQLGPALAFGLTLAQYPAFADCRSVKPLKERIAAESPEIERWGIHVLVSQTASNELTIGDSHEYGLAVNAFDSTRIQGLILEYAKSFLRVPNLEIAEQWHGVYAKHRDLPYLRATPMEGVRVVTVTGGTGMTLSFGLAEETLAGMGP